MVNRNTYRDQQQQQFGSAHSRSGSPSHQHRENQHRLPEDETVSELSKLSSLISKQEIYNSIYDKNGY